MGLPSPVWAVTCPDDSVKAKQRMRGDGLTPRDLYSVCGGRKGLAIQTQLLPQSIPLIGKPTAWSYANCDSRYLKKSTGREHPNAYACFKI
jgi:hypothetical protein